MGSTEEVIVFCLLAGFGTVLEGESSARSLIARVDSLLLAIFFSDGGGGRSSVKSSSSGGVSDECKTG